MTNCDDVPQIMSRFRTMGRKLDAKKQVWVVLVSTHRAFSNRFYSLADFGKPPKVLALGKHRECHFCGKDFKYLGGRDDDECR